MKIIWLLLILSGLSSCCSSQKTTHSVHTQTDQRNDVHTEQSAQSRQQESVELQYMIFGKSNKGQNEKKS